MKLSPAALDKIVWVLVYGGLLLLCLGVFVERQDFAFGWSIVVLGGGLTAAGAVALWLRSRLDDKP